MANPTKTLTIPKTPGPGDDSRKNWKSIEALTNSLRQTQQRLARAEAALTALRTAPQYKQGGSGGGDARWS